MVRVSVSQERFATAFRGEVCPACGSAHVSFDEGSLKLEMSPPEIFVKTECVDCSSEWETRFGAQKYVNLQDMR